MVLSRGLLLSFSFLRGTSTFLYQEVLNYPCYLLDILGIHPSLLLLDLKTLSAIRQQVNVLAEIGRPIVHLNLWRHHMLFSTVFLFSILNFT